MSSGHSPSVEFRHCGTVHYVCGQRPKKNHWFSRRVGWFGRSFVIAMVLILGAFTYELKNVLLAPEGELASIQTVLPFGDRIDPGNKQTPVAAKNIVDLDNTVSDWFSEYRDGSWGVVISSIDGPLIDAEYGAKQQFEARSLYRLFVAAAVYNQLPAEQHKSTQVRVGSQNISVAKCIERLLKGDDTQCADSLGQLLNQDKASQFFKSVGIEKTTLVTPVRTVYTTAADVSNLLDLLDGKDEAFAATSGQAIIKMLTAQDGDAALRISCPGCTVSGLNSYGVGRLEAAGIVKYSAGSYRIVILGDAGTNKEVFKLSGKIQQKIQDTITDVRP